MLIYLSLFFLIISISKKEQHKSHQLRSLSLFAIKRFEDNIYCKSSLINRLNKLLINVLVTSVSWCAVFYLRSSSLGWFLLSRLRSMRSDSRCLRTSVAYSSRPCSAVMISEATLPRSLMENERCISSVRMKVSRNTLLLMSWPNSFRAFSTFCWPFPDTWAEEDGRVMHVRAKKGFQQYFE